MCIKFLKMSFLPVQYASVYVCIDDYFYAWAEFLFIVIIVK